MEPEEGWAEQEDTSPDIQELLDEGYETLDRFVSWLETVLQLDTRAIQQDSFNAESWIDYLANHQRKRAEDANEFELRWFVFSHAIRKSLGSLDTQERLLQSLSRFYSFLRTERKFAVPDWLSRVLDEEGAYLKRLHEYRALDAEDEAAWQRGFQAWSEDLADDLNDRVLSLPREIDEVLSWGDAMGWREATLWDEANQNWQQRRIELLENETNFDEIRRELTDEYQAWLNAPQERLDDETPYQLIVEERASAPERDEDADDEDEDSF